MSQLEKAARAIYEARAKRHGFTVGWEQAGIVDQDRARHDARAVIASILEPSKEMIVVGNETIEECIDSWNYDSDSGYAVEQRAAFETWRAMLRALLAEGEKG